MAVNYNDKRFADVEKEKRQALTENEKMYGGMINSADKYYDAQTEAVEKYGEQQQKLQQENTDFTIEKIEQQKEQAEKDYQKEQSAAYVDWKKQSDPYGADAEKVASNGLSNSGFSESSQTAKYVAYQNRVVAAKESIDRAVLEYNNSMTQARLQNNVALAEISYQTLQKKLELSLAGFQYKNSLLTEQAKTKREIDNTYNNRWQNVLSQINTENALAEQKRQYDQSLAFQKEQFDWQKEQAKLSASGGGSSGGSSRRSSSGKSSKKSSKKSSSGSTTLKKTNTLSGDAKKYGTFSNGYQPKGISGHGTLKKSGDSIVLNGKKQNIWRASDGTYWYWNGSKGKYVRCVTEKSVKESAIRNIHKVLGKK